MGIRFLEFLADNTKGKPNEDFLLHLAYCIFAVGDGVTRFVPEGKDYPNPSPASDVSEIFCQRAANCIGMMYAGFTSSNIEIAIRQAFQNANASIGLFNKKCGITQDTTDYLENDFAGCVGVVGVLLGNTLHYGYIGDCGLMVFDRNLLPVLLTGNDLGVLEQMRDAWSFHSEEEKKLFWRKTIRNRPDARHMTYGTLNGEDEALSYVKTGAVELKTGDTAVLFSDGILPYLFSHDIRGSIVRALDLNDLKNYIKGRLDCHRESLRALGFKNLDDDKAFIAIQLTE